MRALGLALLLFASFAYADDPKCPGPPKNMLPGWELDSTVYYDFGAGTQGAVPDFIQSAFEYAKGDWNDANVTNLTKIRFKRADASHPPNLGITTGALPGGPYDDQWTNARYQPLGRNSETQRLTEARITVDLTKFGPGVPNVFDFARKALVHELGHTMALGHPPSPVPKASVMNPASGPGDSDDNVAMSPTACDNEKATFYNRIINGPVFGGGSGGRSRPSGMPEGPVCQACRIKVPGMEPTPDNPDGKRWGWCCGANQSLTTPRPAWLSPDFTFLALNYRCSMSNWREVACTADLCCLHPDDVPPEDEVQYGTTCSVQGWWAAEARGSCETAAGTPPGAPESQWRCVKKEVCGSGRCEPWPNYCWKVPSTGGGGGGGDDGGGGPPSGKECWQMGWYDGTDAGYDQCTREHADCVTKSDCEGQCYPDPPGYCFQGND